MIVGLTGGIGSGKSTAARLIANKGINIIDADLISHQLTEAHQPALEEIRAYFGNESICADGTLNRTWLRKVIHQTPPLKHVLESILHPKILTECRRQLQVNTNEAYQILMVPLLFEISSFRQLCDFIVTVESAEEIRIQRVMQRSNMTKEGVVAIINNQLSDQERRQQSDYLIYNNGSLESLEQQVDQLDILLREQSNTPNK